MRLRHLRSKITWATTKPWLAVAGLWGAGLLPCPDCGAPMLVHFWPIALVLTLHNLRRRRNPENATLLDDQQAADESEVNKYECLTMLD